jgi:hypothetical protein
MVTIPGHEGNEFQNNTDSTSLRLEWLPTRTPPPTNVGKDAGENGTLIYC